MANRSDILALRVTTEERQLIEQYAQREDRSISAALRRIILKEVKERTPADQRQDGALILSQR